MFTIEAQLGIFILLLVLVGAANLEANKKPILVLAYSWPLAALVLLALIDLIGIAIYLIAGWWQL